MQTSKKKLRIVYWWLQSLIRRYTKHIFLGFMGGVAVVIVIWLLYKPVLTTFFPVYSRIGIVGSYEPTRLPIRIQELISLGLTTISADGQPQPGLATSWEVDSEGKRYFFHLDKNHSWHDGTEFTAHDVNYNFKDVVIAPADRNTLKIEMNDQFTPLPSLFTRPLFKPGLVGLGEYKVLLLDLSGNIVEKLILQKVTNSEQNNELRRNRIEFRFYTTPSDAILAFKLGEIDTIEQLADIPKDLEGESNVTIESEKLNDRYIGLFFNSTHPQLKEKSLRQALSYATPPFDGEEINSPISPTSWAYNGQVKHYSFNLDLAKTTFEKTGMENVTISLTTFPEYLADAEQIAKSWKELGVITQVRVVRAFPQEFDVFLGVQEIPPDPDQYPLWHSTQQETNITRYSNPRIDILLERGRKEQDKDTRAEIYREFQRYLMEDAPVHFLVHPTVYTVKRK